MKKRPGMLLGLLALGQMAALAASPAANSAPTPPRKTATVQFSYDNPKLEPAKYTITVEEDGSGRYRSQRGTASDQSRIQSLPLDRPIRISSRNLDQIFRTARKNKLFAFDCAKGGKHTAFQGTKTLTYQGPEGVGSCTYNWSENKQIESLTGIFEGISFTLQEGSKLSVEDTYSKLLLDEELAAMAQAAQDGSACEIGNIAPILKKIATDDRNLNRVRQRAQKLLALSAN